MSKAIIGTAIIISAVVFSRGIKTLAPIKPFPDQFELVSNNHVMYRLDKTNGRVDVLIPAEEGAYMIPLLQMNPMTDASSKMSKEEQEKWAKISVATSQYLRISQGMSPLQGLKTDAAAPAAEKKAA